MAWFLQHQGKACFSYIDGHASLILRNELPADNTFPFYKFSPRNTNPFPAEPVSASGEKDY